MAGILRIAKKEIQSNQNSNDSDISLKNLFLIQFGVAINELKLHLNAPLS